MSYFCSFLALAALLPCMGLAAESAPATLATNQLGLELLNQVAATAPGGNVLLSPFSIQDALAMTYAGAEGETRTEMARVLHFPADDVRLAAAFAALRQELEDAATTSAAIATDRAREGGKVDRLEWHLANRLFGQESYPFRTPFLAQEKTSFAAPLEQLDFKRAPELARMRINAWVGEQTSQRILDLIPPGGVDKDTRLVLVNALYLKAPWQEPFATSATEERPFQAHGETAVNVPTMRLTKSFGYAKRDGYTAVTLPYLGGDLQFLILLPDAPTGVDALAARITPALLGDCAKLTPRLMALDLPKIRLQTPTLPLGKILQSIGMKSAFNVPRGSANFDRMAPRQPDDYLFLAEVFHKAFLSLDEAGTEAAAATAGAMMRASAIMSSPAPIAVEVDHPFLFAIQLRESGACLFLGRVSDPR